jgi:hypothetical protein
MTFAAGKPDYRTHHVMMNRTDFGSSEIQPFYLFRQLCILWVPLQVPYSLRFGES